MPGALDAIIAAGHFGVSRTRLYELPTAFLRDKAGFGPKPSGGASRGQWSTRRAPPAKGKIERRFGTFRNRMVTLLAQAKAETYEHADEILQMEIIRTFGL